LDRPGRKALLAFSTTAAALSLISAAAAQVTPFPLRAAKWLAAKDAVAALSDQPGECLAAPSDPETAWQAEVGRAVFRSPVLLGGQAAKAGVSCDTCHKNGRRNAELLFPGLSGDPGTADVTSSLMSTHRGDGIFNPRRIPDLAGPADTLVSRRLDMKQLAHFLNGIVTEEFEGDEPPPGVLNGLATYVRRLDAGACPAQASHPLGVTAAADDVARAVKAAEGALARRDDDTALAVLQAARAMLFLIDERYAAPSLATERSLIRTASLDIGSAEGAVRRKAPAGPALDLWLARYPAWQAQLQRAERRSLYDRGELRVAFSGTASAPIEARAARAAAVSPSSGCAQPGSSSANGPITNRRSAALGCGTTTSPSSTTSRP
jgi:hypothetical protein